MQLVEIKVKTSPHVNNKFISFDLQWILYAIPTAYKTLHIEKGTFNSRSMKLKNGDEIVVEGEWFQYITRAAGHSAYNPKY